VQINTKERRQQSMKGFYWGPITTIWLYNNPVPNLFHTILLGFAQSKFAQSKVAQSSSPNVQVRPTYKFAQPKSSAKKIFFFAELGLGELVRWANLDWANLIGQAWLGELDWANLDWAKPSRPIPHMYNGLVIIKKKWSIIQSITNNLPLNTFTSVS